MSLKVEFKMIELPVLTKGQETIVPWPVLTFSAWVKFVFTRTHGEPLLNGFSLEQEDSWRTMLANFWHRAAMCDKTGHPIYRDKIGALDRCIPVLLHGDEGRGKLRRAVLCTSVQPLLHGGGHTFLTRFLFGILPAERYSADNSFDVLHDTLAMDLLSLYEDGFEVPCHACPLNILSSVLQNIDMHACALRWQLEFRLP